MNNSDPFDLNEVGNMGEGNQNATLKKEEYELLVLPNKFLGHIPNHEFTPMAILLLIMGVASLAILFFVPVLEIIGIPIKFVDYVKALIEQFSAGKYETINMFLILCYAAIFSLACIIMAFMLFLTKSMRISQFKNLQTSVTLMVAVGVGLVASLVYAAKLLVGADISFFTILTELTSSLAILAVTWAAFMLILYVFFMLKHYVGEKQSPKYSIGIKGAGHVFEKVFLAIMYIILLVCLLTSECFFSLEPLGGSTFESVPMSSFFSMITTYFNLAATSELTMYATVLTVPMIIIVVEVAIVSVTLFFQMFSKKTTADYCTATAYSTLYTAISILLWINFYRAVVLLEIMGLERNISNVLNVWMHNLEQLDYFVFIFFGILLLCHIMFRVTTRASRKQLNNFIKKENA